ncbi:MAG TPA: ATP-binding protein [Candidatus Acidoferrales bacterium]|nr:ATP-binding protein [Candidatus Acidoferrales bacterium]
MAATFDLCPGWRVASLLEKLPTILILAVLVGMFISLRKHSPSVRTKLWIVAWALIFLHFFVQLFETHVGFVESLFETVDLAALELSGVVFLVSLAKSSEDRFRRNSLLAILAIPVTFHAAAVTFGSQKNWALAGALALFFFGLAAFAFLVHKVPSKFNIILGVVSAIVGVSVVRAQWRGNADFGVIAILTLTFGVSGLLFWKRFPRFTPGVITVAGGFLCWGAVFPIGALVDYLFPHLTVNPEIWNVPKFFVAFGMILSALEDKSGVVDAGVERQHAENAQLLRFSRLTSRLLGGADPAALCGEMAEAITETGSFRRAAILLAREDNSMVLAGSSGYAIDAGEALEAQAAEWNSKRVAELAALGQRVGNNSYWLRGQATRNGNGAALPEMVIPLHSSRGTSLGWIALSSPRSTGDPSAAEMMKVEMLAADIAVTIENSRLHHQLVRSEKLAALGQLVAGVAHELNNPLTGIIGYAELLSDEVRGDGPTKKVTKIGNEARRMHRIVSGLLRFARQNNTTEHAADFEATLRDALQLREYHLRKQGIEIHTEIEPFLPPLAIGEDELKQILLNLLSNATDAIEDCREKTVRIQAAREGDRVLFRFEDTGPGFLDLNRAFDPFYTTKPVGKGTGLGLSICYGIVRECGGDIHLSNCQPYGATVLVELPAAMPKFDAPVHADRFSSGDTSS